MTSTILFSKEPRSLAAAPDFLASVPQGIAGREALFDALQEVLKLPDYFGRNWDALHECLRDFHWIPAKRIVLIHESLPLLPEESLRIYLEVLADATRDWKPGEEHEFVVTFPERDRQRVLALLAT